MRLRTRIFLTLAAVLAVVFGAVVWWTEIALERSLLQQATRELVRSARLLTRWSADEPFSDALADRLARDAALRVTLIDPEGWVLGESDAPPERLPELENHAERPEVRAALEGRIGSDRRASATVARSLLYVAVPHPQGVLRVAEPLEAVDATLAGARRLEILGIGLGLVLAFFLSRWLAAYVRWPLEEAADALGEIGRGRYSTRLPADRGGSVGTLTRSVNALGERLGERVRTLETETDDLTAVFESLEDGLAVVDRAGRVVRANSAFADWAGRRGVVGERFPTLFRSPRMVDAVDRARGGEPEGHELTLGDRTVLMSVQPHRDGALVLLRDLTRLRRLEGVRRDFVANVSHELKTPLTSLLGFAEAIAAGDLTFDQSVEFGRRIVANAQRMRRLVDDLLDLAYVESGGWEPRRARVDVGELCRAVWSSMDALAEERDLTLRVRDEELAPVHADPDSMRQILRNLFDNAIRYAPRASEIVVSGRSEGGMLRISVRDSGPGIPSVHHSRIFERFYRVDPARSREEGGTGLGLSIVKHLVLGHGGDVGVESEVGRGTTVWFTLPLTGHAAPSGAPTETTVGRPGD